MSEYQYIAFRAIDAPVSEKDLEFMRQQSSRAEITSLSFKNEYHFGDFRGNAAEMLRRGYDFHFHFADFGIRKLMIRFPRSLPDGKSAAQYLKDDSLQLLKDKPGLGGILCVNPFIEPGDLDDLWELDDLLDRLLPLRAEMLNGDLRPLYLAHLAVACDGNHVSEEEKDAPVPAGMDKLTDAQRAMAELYGLSEAMIAAAARNSPSLTERTDPSKDFASWLQRQPEAKKNAWLCRLMANSQVGLRSEILADYQKDHAAPLWPTIRLDRTVAEIRAAAEKIQIEKNRRDTEDSARQRAKKLTDMAADPMRTIRETEDLVTQRSVQAYRQVALLLADLRQALSGTDQAGLADKHAVKLKEKNTNLRHLTAELRGQGFLKKSSA